MRCTLLAAAAACLAAPAAASAVYDPAVLLDVPTRGGPGSPAAISAMITQATGEDSHRTIEAVLPGTFGFNTGFAPSKEPIGHVSAASVFGPAEGDLFLTDDYRIVGQLTGLGGLASVPFTGILEVLPRQEIVVRFDDLPDVAATRLSVQMHGGTRTPLALPRTCGTHTIRVRLVGRAGDVLRSEHAVDVGGCRAALPVVAQPRVSGHVLRWRTTGVRTEVTLRRLVAGRWREVVQRTTTATTLRLWRLRRGDRYTVALVALAADGTRGLTRVLRLR